LGSTSPGQPPDIDIPVIVALGAFDPFDSGPQIEDFLAAVPEDRDPMVNGQEGRKSVELFTAIYRSQRDGAPVRFPLTSEPPAATFTVDPVREGQG
jgi:predicted dehydrogenase